MLSAAASGPRRAGDRFADFDADAVQAVAHLVRVTVVVALASDRYANDGGIALHSRRAVALRSVKSDAAEGVGAALIASEHARIQTLAGDAGSVGRTIVVSFALGSEALDVRIAAPSVRTEANRTVLLGAANGVLTAGIANDARILAHLLFASLVRRAVRVDAAFDVSFRNRIAVDVGISGKVFGTLALGLMTDHFADGVVGARIGHSARTHALPVPAALVVRAIVVRQTSRFLDGYASTLDVGIAEIAGQTLASHGAEWQRVDYQALGVFTAWLDYGARIDAFSVEAGVFARALTV